MKTYWNIDPESVTIIARLISDLEGVSLFLECLGEEEELEYIKTMKRKYYKEYFKRIKG